ncbi:hypothetical protein UlMin_008375 [Ulmus minor]
MSCFKLSKTLIKDLHRLIVDFWWDSKTGKTIKGSKASFVWRSIIWGREVIERGSRWRIGSGLNIDVIQDRWVPNPPVFKLFDPPPLPEGFTVFDLCLQNGEWDSEFIHLLFGEEEARKILSLPLGSFEHDDVLI